MFRDWAIQAAMKVGSDAAKADKPRQGRKTATVSRHFWVPSGYLAGAGCFVQAGAFVSTEGARLFYFCVDNVDSMRALTARKVE